MKKKKKKYGDILATLGLVPVAKADLTSVSGNAQGVAKGDVFQMALSFINFAITVIGVLGVIMFIYAGFMYLTSAGDEAKMSKAKNAVIYAIVGVAIAVLGFVAVRTVQQYIVRA